MNNALGAQRAPRGLTWDGLRTVARLELRQRVRSTRWIVTLVVWFVVVGLVTAGVTVAIGGTYGPYGGGSDSDSFGWGSAANELAGRTTFGLVLLFVLLLGLLVAPTLSATSVNGDRAAGTLAVLQATSLTRWDIAVGKLLAAWTAALAFLAASVPALVWSLVLGGTSVWRAVAGVATVAFLLVVVCTIGLAMSAAVSRTSGSAVLTYLVVAALTIGTLIAFGLSVVMLTRTEQVRVHGIPDSFTWEEEPSAADCEWYETTRTVQHTEYTAWLLGLNPFVVVADVAGHTSVEQADDPLSAISEGVRWAQQPPETVIEECWFWSFEEDWSTVPDVPPDEAEGTPYWPWSFAVYLAAGAGALWYAAHRLAVPARRLPRGQRIA